MKQTRRQYGRWILMAPLAVLISLVLSAVTHADAIKLGGFWIEDVTIQGINDSTLSYVTSAGNEAQRKLADVQGIRLTAIPELGQAESLLDSGKELPRAVTLLGEVRGKARQEWLRDWATYRQLFAAAAAQQPMEAVNAYLTLARSAPTAFYLQSFPPQGLKAITNDSLKQAVLRVVDGALGQLSGEAAVAVKQLRTDIAALQIAAAGATGAATDGTGPATSPTTGTEPAAAPDELVLPKDIPGDDAITVLIRAGKLTEAIDAAEKAMRTEATGLQLRLYQKGIAQLHQGLKSDDSTLIKDAGLSFMRLVVFFPRGSYLGPALMEAGLVHHKIGRPDIALSLYDRATVAIDPEDTAMTARLQELKRSAAQGE